MAGKDPNTTRLELLTRWEIDLFIQKCSGKTLEETATARGYKPRVAEFLAGTIYDKTGLTFLSDRQRRSELVSLALSLDAAVRDGTISPPGAEDLGGGPSPEMPSQRALAAVRNDERTRQWPHYTFNFQMGDTRESRSGASDRQRPHQEDETEEHPSGQTDTNDQGDSEQSTGPDAGRQRKGPGGSNLVKRKKGAFIGCGVAGIAMITTVFILVTLVGVPWFQSRSSEGEQPSSMLPVAQLLPTTGDFAHGYEVVAFAQSNEFDADHSRVQEATIEFGLVSEDSSRGPAMSHVYAECVEFADPFGVSTYRFVAQMRIEQSSISPQDQRIHDLGDFARAVTGTVKKNDAVLFNTLLYFTVGYTICRYEAYEESTTFVDELVDVARAATDSITRQD